MWKQSIWSKSKPDTKNETSNGLSKGAEKAQVPSDDLARPTGQRVGFRPPPRAGGTAFPPQVQTPSAAPCCPSAAITALLKPLWDSPPQPPPWACRPVPQPQAPPQGRPPGADKAQGISTPADPDPFPRRLSLPRLTVLPSLLCSALPSWLPEAGPPLCAASCCCSVAVSKCLRPHGPQHARIPCSPTPRVYPNSCPLSRWCHPTSRPLSSPFLLPSIFPSIRVFSSESALRIRWPKYWTFSFNISPSNEHSVLVSFRMDWLALLAVQGTLCAQGLPIPLEWRLLQDRAGRAPVLRLL